MNFTVKDVTTLNNHFVLLTNPDNLIYEPSKYLDKTLILFTELILPKSADFPEFRMQIVTLAEDKNLVYSINIL